MSTLIYPFKGIAFWLKFGSICEGPTTGSEYFDDVIADVLVWAIDKAL